jgi:hypothetical protein
MYGSGAATIPSLDAMAANPVLADTLPAHLVAGLYADVAVLESRLRARLLTARAAPPSAAPHKDLLDTSQSHGSTSTLTSSRSPFELGPLYGLIRRR